MALPICLEIPELGDPPVITLPGGVSIQQFNLMEAIQPALTPLRRPASFGRYLRDPGVGLALRT